ncbi:MAG TPA: hypothetical protein VFI40_01900 [Nocardioides sp.]|nr:hypothetical protein [Nocardioides sp.]
MNLRAAFLPPAPVRDELAALVRAQEPAPEAAGSGRRGLFGRRTAEPPTAPTASTATSSGNQPLLRVLDPERVLVPVTDFGHLASGDARRVVDAVTAACAELPPGPTVRISGGAALVDPDDRSVWAELAASDEDVSAMRAVAQTIVSAVQPLGLFCDRRQFKPRFPIATITDATTVEHLEQVLAALAAYTSDPWTVGEVAVVQRGSGVWRTVPIGGCPDDR